MAPGLAGVRWLAFEGCPPWTLPHLLSELTSARCEMICFQGGLDLRNARVAPGLAGLRWLALAGCQLAHPLFF